MCYVYLQIFGTYAYQRLHSKNNSERKQTDAHILTRNYLRHKLCRTTVLPKCGTKFVARQIIVKKGMQVTCCFLNLFLIALHFYGLMD